MTNENVSPLPWEYNKDREDVLSADGLPVVVSGFRLSGGSRSRNNREFIVRAVNAHDRLVAAIERFIAAADDSCDARPGHGDVAAILEYNTAFTELSAALAAAKEGK